MCAIRELSKAWEALMLTITPMARHSRRLQLHAGVPHNFAKARAAQPNVELDEPNVTATLA